MKTKHTLHAAYLMVLFVASCEYQKSEVTTPNLIMVLYDISASVDPARTQQVEANFYSAYLKKNIVAHGDKVLLAFIGSSGVNKARAKSYQVNCPHVLNPDHNEIEALQAQRIYKQRLREQIDSLLTLIDKEISQTPKDAPHTGILELFPLIQTAIENHKGHTVKVLMVSDMLQDTKYFQLAETRNQLTEIKIQAMSEVTKWKDSTVVLLREQFGIENDSFMEPVSEVVICSPCFTNSSVNCPENMGYVEAYWQRLFAHYHAYTPDFILSD